MNSSQIRKRSVVINVVISAVTALALTTGAGQATMAAPAGPDVAATVDLPRPQGVDKSGQPHQPADEAALMGSAGPAISRATIIARAQTWASIGVPYSMEAYRDGYRTDCSGYVSMAWATNGNFWTGDLHTIGVQLGGYHELRAGDMLLYHNQANPVVGSHVVIFDRWTGAVGGDFYIYEQTPPATKHRLWSQAGYSRSLYIPFKYVNVVEDPATPTPGQASQVSGDVNGDGRDDVIAISHSFDNHPDIWYFPSTSTASGASLGSPISLQSPPAPAWNMNYLKWAVGDFNGDGRDDLFAASGGGGNPINMYIFRTTSSTSMAAPAFVLQPNPQAWIWERVTF